MTIDARDAPIEVARAPGQRGLLPSLLLVAIALTALFQGVQQILIPAQLEAVDPAAKIGNLALFTVAGAVSGVVGLLVGGVVSDHTSGRWGRRTPTIVIGCGVSVVLIVIMGMVDDLAPLFVVSVALWFAANYYQGAWTAILPDRVPRERRGVGAAVIALGMPIGVIVGVNIAAQLDRADAYLAIAALFLLATFVLLAFAREVPALPRMRSTANGAPGALVRFVSAFRSRDFTLAFVGRALMFLSAFGVTGYTYFIVQDHIGAANVPGQNVQVAVSTLISIQMLCCVLSAAVGGWLADRWQRPKLFVAVSSIGMALALIIPMVSPTWPAMVALQVCIGLFFGAYLAVDLALMSLVLPNHEDEGRDMAILTVATAAPQVLSPVVAAGLIAWLGYPSLFAFGALTAFAAAVVVFFIRSVR